MEFCKLEVLTVSKLVIQTSTIHVLTLLAVDIINTNTALR